MPHCPFVYTSKPFYNCTVFGKPTTLWLKIIKIMKVPQSIVKKNTEQLFFYLVELVDNNNCPERIRC